MTLSVETLAEAMSTQRFLRDFNLRTWWGAAEGQPPGTVRLTDEEKEDWRQSATAAFAAIVQAACVIVPIEPSDGLLVSMAIRSDHALAVPGYYDGVMFSRTGTTHAQRLEFAKRNMAQLHEEVVGTGFYRPEAEAGYASKLSAAPKIQHSEGE